MRMTRPDVSARMIQSGSRDWFVVDKKTGKIIDPGGPFETKAQAKNECWHLPSGSYTIKRKSEIL